MSDGGKGSGRRPGQGYQDNWDRIFGNKPEPSEQQDDEQEGDENESAG